MNDIVLACIGVFIGEFYGNFVGGGSIVTQFFLQNIIGIDLKSAIALDNSAVLGSEIGLLYVLFKRHRIQRGDWMFTLFVLIGAYFGAQGLHVIPLLYLRYIFVGVLVIVVAKSFLLPDKEQNSEAQSTIHPIALNTFAVIVGAYNAFLSIGDWLFALTGLVLLFRLPYQRSVFLLAFSLFFGRVLAASQYVAFGYVDFAYWIPMFMAALVSGVSAGLLIDKVQTKHIKPVLKLLGLVLAIYLALSLFQS